MNKIKVLKKVKTLKKDHNVVDPKKDDIKFQINEMTFLVKLVNMILTLPKKNYKKAYEISEIDIKSDKIFTNLIEDKFLSQIFEYINVVFQNSKK